MVIPCIDLMGGKVVQLVKGETKALELDSPDQAVEMFQGFPLLHIIDLDAALGRGENRDLIRHLLTKVRARVGGGIRFASDAEELLQMGAHQVIVGTSAFSENGINTPFLESLAEFGQEEIIVAVDVKDGHVAVKGWRNTVEIKPAEAIEMLEPYCAGFLCTYVDLEGMMKGTNLPFFFDLRVRTKKSLTAAGGITTIEEVRSLAAAGIEVALGMAVYTGRLSLDELSAI